MVSYDTVNQTAGMVSIPRDTMILNSSGKVRKINSAYNNGGIDQVKTEIRKLLGIPIDFYIKVSLNGFVKGIDALDGIDFEVPVNMNYDDPTPVRSCTSTIPRGCSISPDSRPSRWPATGTTTTPASIPATTTAAAWRPSGASSRPL